MLLVSSLLYRSIDDSFDVRKSWKQREVTELERLGKCKETDIECFLKKMKHEEEIAEYEKNWPVSYRSKSVNLKVR